MKRRNLEERMMQIYHEYINEHGKEPVNAHHFYEWARKSGRWVYQPSPTAQRNQFTEQFSQAMRQQIYYDPQGRSVRTKQAVRKEIDGVQTTLWGDLRYDPVDFIKLSFSQRRKQQVDDNERFKIDVDSFNENRVPREPYVLILDYTEDVAEREIGRSIRKDFPNAS